MTLRLANYLKGSVKVRISGHVPEKFINLCVAERIFLWGLLREDSHLYAWMALNDFYRIRPLVRRSRAKVTVVTYSGWPFLAKRILRRKMLVLGAVFCIITVQILASYIWFVEVVGTRTVLPEQVLSVAQQQGLRLGMARDTISVKPVENAILLELPQISWVSVSFTGTRAVIEVVERTVPQPEDKKPAHIIADKDGIITEIIALSGQASVKKGDNVKKGDLLIKGFVQEQPTPAASGQPKIITLPAQLVKANGIIKARIWHESYGEAPLTQEMKSRTGRQELEVILNLGGHEVILKKGNPSFVTYDSEVIHKTLPGWRNSQFVVESTIRIYHEIQSLHREISMEEARDEATGRALTVMQQLIPESAQILARHIEILKLNEKNLVRVKVSAETIEDIGKSIAITQR